MARWGRLGDWCKQAVEQAPLSGAAVAGPDAVLGVHPLPLSAAGHSRSSAPSASTQQISAVQGVGCFSPPMSFKVNHTSSSLRNITKAGENQKRQQLFQ